MGERGELGGEGGGGGGGEGRGRGSAPPRHRFAASSKRLEGVRQGGGGGGGRVTKFCLKHYIRKHPEYAARLVAAPTRFASHFAIFQKSIGSAWQTQKKTLNPKP